MEDRAAAGMQPKEKVPRIQPARGDIQEMMAGPQRQVAWRPRRGRTKTGTQTPLGILLISKFQVEG